VRISGDGIALHDTRQADGSVEATYLNAGTNPPKGVVVTYYLKGKADGPVTLTFMDSKGEVIKKFSSEGSEGFGSRVGTAAGTNQFAWNMTYPNARQLPRGDWAGVEWANARPALVVPGGYKVRLRVGGQDYEQNFVIKEDPRIQATQQDLEAQFDLMMKIDAEIDTVTDTVHQIQKARDQVTEVEKQAQGRAEVEAAAEKLDSGLYGIESNLVRMIDPAHPAIAHPKTVNLRLAELTTVVEGADAAPTKQSYDVLDLLSSQETDAQNQLKPMLEQQLSALLKIAGGSGAAQ
jgi:hypothetical protein